LNKRKRKKNKTSIWNAEKLDPLVNEYLSSYEHTIDRSVSPIKHTFTLKEGITEHRINQLMNEIYPAVEHLTKATLRAYRKCSEEDVHKMLPDLVPDVIQAFRIYYKSGPGHKPFTYLLFLIKTRFSRYYKGLFPSSSLYGKKTDLVQVLKNETFLNDQEKEYLQDMYQQIIDNTDDKDLYVHTNKSTVSLRRKTKTQHISDEILKYNEANEAIDIHLDIDYKDLRTYIPAVNASGFHKKIANLILDELELIAKGGSFNQGRRAIHSALKEVIQDKLGTSLKIADVKMGIFTIRKALNEYHEDAPSCTNVEETLLINKIEFNRERR